MRICLIRSSSSKLPAAPADPQAAPAGPGNRFDPDFDRAAVARAATLGFDHVLLAGLSVLQAEPARLAAIARQCREEGMNCLLELALDRYPADRLAPGVSALDPDWLVPDTWTDGTLEADSHHAGQRLRWDTSHVAACLVPWWAERLRGLAAAGVAGFVCLAPARVPGRAWGQLLETVRRDAPTHPLTFIAWTPGANARQLTDLAPRGFDGAVCSLPWWDFRGTWLVEEFARLRPFGRILAAPALEPFGNDALAARRALWTAAAIGDSLLVPAGFELGGTQAGMNEEAGGFSDAPGAEGAIYDLSHELMHANAWQRVRGDRPALALRQLTGPDAPATVLARVPMPGGDRHGAGGADAAPTAIAINADTRDPATLGADRVVGALSDSAGHLLAAEGGPGGSAQPGTRLVALDAITLAPAGIQFFYAPAASQAASVVRSGKRVGAAVKAEMRRNVEAALQAPRIAIENVTPVCDGGRFAVRGVVGDRIEVSADIWMDGHDKLAAALLWRTPDEIGADRGADKGDKDNQVWHEQPLTPGINDRWTGQFPLVALGRHEFTVLAWRDTFGSWCDEVQKKRLAGVDVTLETEEGARLVIGAATTSSGKRKGGPAFQGGERRHDGQALEDAMETLDTIRAELEAAADHDTRRLEILLAPATRAAMTAADPREFSSRHPVAMPVEADRLAARFASWYELFPRSESGDPHRHGTFADVARRLPAIRAMGFDVLYFPPIHPIGNAHRKGRNNSLKAGPTDPGSPYAIGGEQGGHDAIHPELGTIEDFRALRAAAAANGLELALDFAIQCSPDHPWLRQHPEWFSRRPDGSVRYAENPPKKYEDIVNVDFYAEQHAPELWVALRDVVLFWASEGVRIFRVDNPHTKPLPFWEWMIADVRRQYPDAIFLAEAFTRPKMMARLAKVGFAQSYTYFTWRNRKQEIADYMVELTSSPLREVYRPHFFVNTPDINPWFLHDSGRPGFLIRAALATMLSGLWGMYSGFEICESAPLILNGAPREEYLDSEKYQIRIRNWEQPGNIVAEITRLNAIRAGHPALQNHLGVRFYRADNDNVLWFARFLSPPASAGAAGAAGGATRPAFGDDVILVAVSLDPRQAQEAAIELPLWEWGLPDDGALATEDLMTGQRFTWQGKYQRIRLDPQALPFSVWHVRPAI